jgi:hypothetical protein
MRRALALSLALSVATAACTSLIGDFSLVESRADGGLRDSSIPVDSPVPDAPTATVVATISTPPPVFIGQSVTLDASDSTTTQGVLTFSWVLESIPVGSRLSTPSHSPSYASTLTFVPDVAGNYLFTVTVSAEGATDSQQVTVTAVAPEIMFAQGDAPDAAAGSSPTLDYFVSDLSIDGGSAAPLICSDASVPSGSARLGAYSSRAFDFWEAPPGAASKFAAFTWEAFSDAGYTAHLWAGTFDASCPAIDLGTARFGPNAPFGSEPRFSPDGTRFAVFDKNWTIVTFASDGNGATHAVATYGLQYSEAGSALDPVDEQADSGYVLEPPRVTWTAAGDLAWAIPSDESDWEVVIAHDFDSAPLTTYMTCSGVTPREIAMLPDGTVIASYRDSREGSEDMYRLKPDVLLRCVHEVRYTMGTSTASVATDFALSPDGTEIAFLQRESLDLDAGPWPEGIPGGYLFVAPVSGDAPVQISTERVLYGPRWIAGGAALSFTRFDGIATPTGDIASSVVVVGVDGGSERIIASGDGVHSFVSTSGSAACSAASGRRGESLPGTMGALLGALASIRRRRPRASGR